MLGDFDAALEAFEKSGPVTFPDKYTLAKLVETLMAIALEQAGAEFGPYPMAGNIGSKRKPAPAETRSKFIFVKRCLPLRNCPCPCFGMLSELKRA